MDELLSIFPWLGLAYLVGSVPTGVLLGKFHGKDPREHGSGNIGASNVARVLGRKAAFVTVFIDISKGVIPPVLCTIVNCDETTVLCSAFASIIGHCFPIWLKFKGGKGVATAMGTMLVIKPIVAVIAIMVWIMIVYFTRIPAIASLAAAALFVALPQLEPTPFAVHCYTLAVAVVIWLRHGSNIGTLKRRFEKKKKSKGRRR